MIDGVQRRSEAEEILDAWPDKGFSDAKSTVKGLFAFRILPTTASLSRPTYDLNRD